MAEKCRCGRRRNFFRIFLFVQHCCGGRTLYACLSYCHHALFRTVMYVVSDYTIPDIAFSRICTLHFSQIDSSRIQRMQCKQCTRQVQPMHLQIYYIVVCKRSPFSGRTLSTVKVRPNVWASAKASHFATNFRARFRSQFLQSESISLYMFRVLGMRTLSRKRMHVGACLLLHTLDMCPTCIAVLLYCK
jgi:hypothetical protein